MAVHDIPISLTNPQSPIADALAHVISHLENGGQSVSTVSLIGAYPNITLRIVVSGNPDADTLTHIGAV